MSRADQSYDDMMADCCSNFIGGAVALQVVAATGILLPHLGPISRDESRVDFYPLYGPSCWA